jgi:hypothetical protein
MYNAKNYTEQGGEKTVIGGTIDLTNATILGNVATQADSVATTAAGAVADLNALIAKLKASGLMKTV